MVFGRNNKSDQISKSWSDLWEEEESEGEDIALEQRREQNSRSWSHESIAQDSSSSLTRVLREARSASILNSRSQPQPSRSPAPERRKSFDKPAQSENVAVSPKAILCATTASPKKSSLDKWAALGDKRRNFKPSEVSFESKRFPNNMTWRKDWGLGSSGFDYGSWAKKEPVASQDRRRRQFLSKEWRRDSLETPKPVNVKPVVNHDYDSTVDEDLDLVGGWHDLHL
jgi:hypothetical protein